MANRHCFVSRFGRGRENRVSKISIRVNERLPEGMTLPTP